MFLAAGRGRAAVAVAVVEAEASTAVIISDSVKLLFLAPLEGARMLLLLPMPVILMTAFSFAG